MSPPRIDSGAHNAGKLWNGRFYKAREGIATTRCVFEVPFKKRSVNEFLTRCIILMRSFDITLSTSLSAFNHNVYRIKSP